MKDDFDDAQYYKKGIEKFSKYNEDEICKYFNSIKYGTIVMGYPITLEKEIYKKFALILNKKYTKYCDENDVVETLLSYGHIYTAQMQKRTGMYHSSSANILIYSFLNKLDENIVHELIHKLGFLRFNKDFYSMPRILQEAGTELMTNTVLDKPNCRELLLGNLWTRSVGVQPRYLIETSLVNQLNVACGNDLLERSLLEGKNYFEPEIKKLIGEDEYILLLTKITDICRLEKRYWKENQKKSLEKQIVEKIDEYQDMILYSVFNRRISKIKSIPEAREILQDLMQFSDYRVKSDKPDEKFNEYFKHKKQQLEEQLNISFDVDDISDSWKTRYPIIKLEETAYSNEKEKIDVMAEQLKGEKRGIFARLIGRKTNKIAENSKMKLPNSVDFEYVVAPSENSIHKKESEHEEKIDNLEK